MKKRLTLSRMTVCTLVTFWAVPGLAAVDSTDTELQAHQQRAAVDYLLYAPSFVLKLPVRVLGFVASGPVKLAEDPSIVSAAEPMFSFGSPYGIKPLAGYSSRTGLQGGFRFKARSWLGTGIISRGRATVSTTGNQFLSLRLGGPPSDGRTVGLEGEVGYRKTTRERFFGLGPSTAKAAETNYELKGAFGGARAYWQFARVLTAKGFFSYRHSEAGEGDDRSRPNDRDDIVASFPDDDLFGLFATLDLYEFGGSLTLDWRDRPGSPLKGGIEVLKVSYVTGTAPGDTSVGFWRIMGSATQYINLFRGRVIGLRVAAQHTEQDEDTRIPFYELASLGGPQYLRGYQTGRFRARDMVIFSAEYRWPLWRKLDSFLFTDQGRVFDDISKDFGFSDYQSTYGVGLRLWDDEGHIGLTFAKGREALRVNISAGEVF